MGSTVRQFFVMQARHLQDGRIDAIARAYSIPLVVALPDLDPGYVVLSTRASVERFFRLKYDGLKAAGVPGLRVAVTDSKVTAGDKLVASVIWYYRTPDGARAGATSARYFLERHRGCLSVQMIEFEKIAFPSLVTWFQQAGQTTTHPPSGHIH